MPGVRAWASPIESTTSRPLRGGYGIYYANVAFNQGGAPTQGFASSPFAPNNTNGIFPAHHLDAGFPADRVQFPPFIDPTINIGGNVIAVNPAGLTLPRFQNWSVTYQRQLTGNMMLTTSYIGNRGSRLNHHWQTYGVDANMNHPDVLALGTPVLQANINSDLARNAGITPPYPGFTGNVAQALRMYPQYQKSNGAETRLAGANTMRRKWYWNVGSRVVCRRASPTRTPTS